MENGNQIRKTACVTGAAGYLASWLVKRLLMAGYYVKGTVRDPGDEKKVAHLWALKGANERLELAKADLMEDGSFDNAIMGCEAVFHTASPVVLVKSDPKTEIVDPAVRGTLNVLKSCKKNPDLKRVVLTSSSATVRARDNFDPRIPLDESSWSSIDLCQRRQIWYALAKTLAEQAAWQFAEANGLDLVAVLPSFVIGPSLPFQLCSTASDVLDLLKGDSTKFAWHGRMGYVHIDDVARCHILVYEDSNAQGRYLCSSRVTENYELGQILNARYPSLHIPTRFENFHPERQHYDFDVSKATKLGLQFRSIEEMFDDCVASLKEQGHLLF